MSDDKERSVEDCRRVGYALARGFLDPEVVNVLRREVAALVERRYEAGEAMFFFEEDPSGKRRLVRIERIWEVLSVLAHGETGKRLFALAEAFFGTPAAIFKDKVNIRHAGSKGYAPHQDSAAGWDAFASRFLTIGVFLDHSNQERGGFEVADCAHLCGRLHNDKGKMSLSHFQSLRLNTVEAEPGDIILLDSEAPHRTFENRSEDDSFHLLITFEPRGEADHRSAYYAKKASDLDGNSALNEFKFRVFSFE